jgi:hypothetical protein
MFSPQKGSANIAKLPELDSSSHPMDLVPIPPILIRGQAFHPQVKLLHNHSHLPEIGPVNTVPQKKPKLNLLAGVPSSCLKLFTMAAINHRHLLAH